MNCGDVRKCMRPAAANEAFVCQLTVNAQSFDWLQPYDHSTTSNGLSGTGFILDGIPAPEGFVHIVTAYHVVDGAINVLVHLDSIREPRPGSVVCFNPDLDAAIVRMKLAKGETSLFEKAQGLSLGNSDLVRPLDPVRVLGFAHGDPLQSTAGVVSGRTSEELQLDAAINPGNSGGPVLDSDGRVVGIVVSGASNAQLVNYCCPINEAVASFKRMLTRVDTSPQPVLERIASLNARLCSSSESLLRTCSATCEGACVTYIHPESSLCSANGVGGWSLDRKGGVREGDFICAISTSDFERTEIDRACRVRMPKIWPSPLDYQVMLSRHACDRRGAEQTVRLWVQRQGENGEGVFEARLQDVLCSFRKMYPPMEPVEYCMFAGAIFMPLCPMHMQASKAFANKFRPIIARPEDAQRPIIVVTHIHPESPFLRGAKLRLCDEVTHVNGTRVTSFVQFKRLALGGNAITTMHTDAANVLACTHAEATAASDAVDRRLGVNISPPRTVESTFSQRQSRRQFTLRASP